MSLVLNYADFRKGVYTLGPFGMSWIEDRFSQFLELDALLLMLE